MHASVPELVKRTISTAGTASMTCSGSGSGLGLGAGVGAGVGLWLGVRLGVRVRVGEVLGHHLGELVLEGARRAERGALLHGLGDGGEHGVVGVADDGRAPRADVVDVLVAVDVVRLG